MSGSEIVDEWKGKQVSVMVRNAPTLRGEVVRTDAVGMLLATEELLFDVPPEVGGGKGMSANEDSIPMFCFVPWEQIEVLIPQPNELP